MIGCGNFNLDNEAPLGQPLIMASATNGIATITTAPNGIAPLVQVLTVETLPAASVALKGTVVAVSDSAASPTLGTALTGGGAVFCLALCTGAAWVAV